MTNYTPTELFTSPLFTATDMLITATDIADDVWDNEKFDVGDLASILRIEGLLPGIQSLQGAWAMIDELSAENLQTYESFIMSKCSEARKDVQSDELTNLIEKVRLTFVKGGVIARMWIPLTPSAPDENVSVSVDEQLQYVKDITPIVGTGKIEETGSDDRPNSDSEIDPDKDGEGAAAGTPV